MPRSLQVVLEEFQGFPIFHRRMDHHVPGGGAKVAVRQIALKHLHAGVPSQCRRLDPEGLWMARQHRDPPAQAIPIPGPGVGLEQVATHEPGASSQEDPPSGQLPPGNGGGAFIGVGGWVQAGSREKNSPPS